MSTVEQIRAERDTAVQALWDVYAALGFDTDGDATPAATVSGMGVAGFARLVVNAAAEHRREMEADYDRDVAGAWDHGLVSGIGFAARVQRDPDTWEPSNPHRANQPAAT